VLILCPERGLGDVGKKRFSCSWTYNWQVLHERKVFTLEEEGVLHRLQSYIFYRDNTVIDFDTGLPMTRKQIAKLIGMSEKQTGRILESLKNKNAILIEKRGRNNAYTINPCLFWKGTERDREFSDLHMAFFKEIKNMRLPKNCPALVRVRGRPIPIWDMDVYLKGHGCPLFESYFRNAYPLVFKKRDGGNGLRS